MRPASTIANLARLDPPNVTQAMKNPDREQHAAPRVFLFVALSLSALAVYLPRTCRALTVMGDSAEIVTAGANWGVPHPPGYPLYTLIAHILSRLPALDLPFRIHLSSAVFHAITAGVVGSTIEVITGSLAAGFLGAALLALGRVFFLGSLYAEVFPLNDLLVACLIWFAVRFARPPSRRGAPARHWQLPALLLGLSLAHHHMVVLAFPALAILIAAPLRRDARDRPRAIAGAFLCALAPPLFFYALIPFAASRYPLPSWGDVHDLGSLWHLVTRQDYGGLAHASRRLVDGQLLERLDAMSDATAESFGIVGVLLFLAGALWGIRYERRTCVALLAAIFCSGPIFAALNAFDIHSEYRIAFFERFTTMCHVPFAVMVGVGAAQLERWLVASPRLSLRAARTTVAVLAALAVGPRLTSLASFDLSGDRLGLAYAHDLVGSTPDGALVLLKSDMASQAALFACGVEDRCGNRMLVTPGQLWMPWKRRELARRYPGLPLPPSDVASTSRWLVEQSLPSRPVFIHPELVDEVVHGDLSTLPSLLLFRVYPNEPALRFDLPKFRAELEDIVRGRRCEGCSLADTVVAHHPANAQLEHIYDAALRAHAAAAAELQWTEEARAISTVHRAAARGR